MQLKLSLQLHFTQPLKCFASYYWYLSFAECHCLNGGTCITYQFFSHMKRCLCPEGYGGLHCEIGRVSTFLNTN